MAWVKNRLLCQRLSRPKSECATWKLQVIEVCTVFKQCISQPSCWIPRRGSKGFLQGKHDTHLSISDHTVYNAPWHLTSGNQLDFITRKEHLLLFVCWALIKFSCSGDYRAIPWSITHLINIYLITICHSDRKWIFSFAKKNNLFNKKKKVNWIKPHQIDSLLI